MRLCVPLCQTEFVRSGVDLPGDMSGSPINRTFETLKKRESLNPSKEATMIEDEMAAYVGTDTHPGDTA